MLIKILKLLKSNYSIYFYAIIIFIFILTYEKNESYKKGYEKANIELQRKYSQYEKEREAREKKKVEDLLKIINDNEKQQEDNKVLSDKNKKEVIKIISKDANFKTKLKNSEIEKLNDLTKMKN